MNLASWTKKKFIAVSEDERENIDNVAAFIRANPGKVYLLPAANDFDLLSREELTQVRFGIEIKFPCPATLISSSKKFTVNALSEMLELATDEDNFLIVPENFSETADTIRRQCFLLQVPIKICSETEFVAVAVEQKLREHAESILQEITAAKNFLHKTSELKLAENVSTVERFFSATEKLERYLKSSDAPIKLAVTGVPRACEILATGLRNLNFDTEIISDGLNTEQSNNFDAIIFTADVSDIEHFKEFLQTMKSSPHRDKIIFVTLRPALRDQDSTTNPARKLSELANLSDAEGFVKNLIFFLDAPDVFLNEKILRLTQNNEEPLAVEDIMNLLVMTGRDEFLTRMSLEKFFVGQPFLPCDTLLKKSGVICFTNYLRQVGQKISATENLFDEVNAAFSMMSNEALKNIRLNQLQQLADDERQAENYHDKISLIAAHGKILQDDTTIKAVLFDVNSAINNFVRDIERAFRELADKLIATEEFSSEKLAALHGGKISSELQKLIAEAEKNLQAEYSRLAEKFSSTMAKVVENYQTRANEFLQFVCASTGSNPTLPELKNPALPKFETGLIENFSRDNLTKLVKHNTEIFCIEEAVDNWDDFKVDRARLLKRLYLSGTFRTELRQHLETTARDKSDCLEKVLQTDYFTALVEYFGQVSKICREQQEFCLNVFRKQTERISEQTDYLIRDSAIMAELACELTEFHSMRLICTEQAVSSPVDEKFLDALSNEVIERKNLLVLMKDKLATNNTSNFSVQKFLPSEAPTVKSSSEKNLSAAKSALRNKKYDNALKLFSKAAASGHVEAIKYLAYMNQKGFGTPKNIYRAIENYLDAFRLGEADAASELAEICLSLNRLSCALKWYQTASDNGDKYSLGVLEN